MSPLPTVSFLLLGFLLVVPALVFSREVFVSQPGHLPFPVAHDVNASRRPLPFVSNAFLNNQQRRNNNVLSCTRRCGLPGHNANFPCQCHSHCQEFNNCCQDFQALCLSCRGRCRSPFSKHAPCQCNTKCTQYENCCPDYKTTCSKKVRPYGHEVFNFHRSEKDDFSCVGRCIDGIDPSKPCQCNSHCSQFSDCCDDYEEVCVLMDSSCFDRCDIYDPSKPCQCNDRCAEFENCCLDYTNYCVVPDQPGDVTDAELAAISEELLSLDIDNNAASLVTIRTQATSPGDGSDAAPLPLLEVQAAAYDKPTIAKLLVLHDNYEATVTIPEQETPEERQEVSDFLDAILVTPIMTRTSAFLAEKGIVPISNFRETFHRIWFGLYSRGNGVDGSSGFEHVFLGELKNGVSGFHHWTFFAREELNNNLNYKGYIKEFSLGSKGMAISESFEWRNVNKPISSMFIGTSPEFELALYTICWYARPNAICRVNLNDRTLKIQTYDISNNLGEKFVATAYPDV